MFSYVCQKNTVQRAHMLVVRCVVSSQVCCQALFSHFPPIPVSTSFPCTSVLSHLSDRMYSQQCKVFSHFCNVLASALTCCRTFSMYRACFSHVGRVLSRHRRKADTNGPASCSRISAMYCTVVSHALFLCTVHMSYMSDVS